MVVLAIKNNTRHGAMPYNAFLSLQVSGLPGDAAVNATAA